MADPLQLPRSEVAIPPFFERNFLLWEIQRGKSVHDLEAVFLERKNLHSSHAIQGAGTLQRVHIEWHSNTRLNVEQYTLSARSFISGVWDTVYLPFELRSIHHPALAAIKQVLQQTGANEITLCSYFNAPPVIPMLAYDEKKRMYTYAPAPEVRFTISSERFEDAVTSYMKQYRCSRAAATHRALMQENWIVEDDHLSLRL